MCYIKCDDDDIAKFTKQYYYKRRLKFANFMKEPADNRNRYCRCFDCLPEFKRNQIIKREKYNALNFHKINYSRANVHKIEFKVEQ